MDLEEKYQKVREMLEKLTNVAVQPTPDRKGLRDLAFEATNVLAETDDSEWEDSEAWNSSSCVD